MSSGGGRREEGVERRRLDGQKIQKKKKKKTDDNIWTDQNLQLDPDLPSGWRTIKDSTGTYYWHVPTGTTQWQHPALSKTPQILDTQVEPTDTGHAGRTLRYWTRRYMSVVFSLRSSWHEEYLTNHGRDSKCFAVRSLGWLQVEEEDLSPGRSSLAVSNCIQQLSHCNSPEQRDRMGAWGEGREMMLVLKKDTLSLLDPLDNSPLHCQPIINIRVWGVGCNNGRDFAFVAGDKDSCMLKCHVFRCDAPAKAIATALHEMCSKIMSEQKLLRPTRSLTMESISPEDLPRQVEFLEAVRKEVQKFEVQYIGNLPVSRAMGMEVLNRAIESIMNSTDRDDWEPIVIHVTDKILSLWKGQEGEEPFWECQVRFLTFLGVGHDSRTFAVIVDGGTQRFECHVFWCEPDAGNLSEAVQAACMVQYQKCLVAQTPPPRTKSWHATPTKVKRANSMDGASFPPFTSRLHGSGSTSMISRSTKSNGNVRKGMMAFFETFRNKQSATS
ncbi:amyloid-beta A4 precursor protein-binding family B member 3 [Scomber scombrus]|uniref:Amyloid-beta A4 precursor protein-binding family B member 3 n=1 Tax=Scomber scombrus TaxID=13677 RepID=A0AAV1Q5V1_SCOSC